MLLSQASSDKTSDQATTHMTVQMKNGASIASPVAAMLFQFDEEQCQGNTRPVFLPFRSAAAELHATLRSLELSLPPTRLPPSKFRLVSLNPFHNLSAHDVLAASQVGTLLADLLLLSPLLSLFTAFHLCSSSKGKTVLQLRPSAICSYVRNYPTTGMDGMSQDLKEEDVVAATTRALDWLSKHKVLGNARRFQEMHRGLECVAALAFEFGPAVFAALDPRLLQVYVRPPALIFNLLLLTSLSLGAAGRT